MRSPVVGHGQRCGGWRGRSGWASEDARSVDGDAPVAAAAGARCGIGADWIGDWNLEGEILRY